MVLLDTIKDMECERVERPKPSILNRIKCFFGVHAWEYYGTFNDEFDLEDITNERMCIFCNAHEIETDLENETWKKG